MPAVARQSQPEPAPQPEQAPAKKPTTASIGSVQPVEKKGPATSEKSGYTVGDVLRAFPSTLWTGVAGVAVLLVFAVIIIGVFMRTQAAALALSFLLIFFPAFFMTGIFFPIASMPEIVRLEALGLPGTHYAIITRGIFLTGVGLDVLWPYGTMLIGLGLAFTGVAALFFRKRLG